MKVDQIRDGAMAVLARFDTLKRAAPSLSEYLGPALDCRWVALWKAVPGSGSLHAISVWQASSAQSKLKDFTTHWQPSDGEGMVGKAWRTSRPQRSSNVVQDMILPRSLHADRSGIASGLWVPVAGPRGGFVVEYLWSFVPDKPLTDAVEKLGREIEEFVRRAPPPRP